MIRLTIILAMVLSVLGCNKPDIEEGTPKCIDKKIKKFSQGATCESAEVAEFKFQSNIVYVFSPGNCGADQSSEVFAADCKYLGYLGGMTGNMKMEDGEDFSNAVFVRNVWEK